MTVNKHVITPPATPDFLLRFNERRTNPVPSVQNQGNNEDAFEAAVLVQADVETGLANSFTEVGSGFQVLERIGAMADRTAGGRRRFSVPWLFSCRQTGPLGAVAGDEQDGLAALQPQPDDAEPVIIEGVSIGIETERGANQYEIRRYIDWDLVLAQLGVTTTVRGGDPNVRLRRTIEDVDEPIEPAFGPPTDS